MECIIRDIVVDYEVYGEGKPIVILNKSMIINMEPVLEKMTGWKRIYVDTPGIGKTQVKDWIKSSDVILKVLLDFIDQVVGKEKYLLIGFSYMGYLARGVLSKRIEDVEGIALICPVITADNFKRDIPGDRVSFRDKKFISSLSEDDAEELSNYVVQDKNIWHKLQGLKSKDTGAMNVEFFSRLKQNGCYEFSFDVDKLVKTFQKPALIILGRQDCIVGYKDAWKVIENFPRASFTILDMAGHNLQLEQDYLLDTLVSDWLGRVKMNFD